MIKFIIFIITFYSLTLHIIQTVVILIYIERKTNCNLYKIILFSNILLLLHSCSVYNIKRFIKKIIIKEEIIRFRIIHCIILCLKI